MDKNNLTQEQYALLLERILSTLAEKGLADTTMDLLARQLSMSKRTLYEIFGSKDDMLRVIMSETRKKYSSQVENIIHSSNNVMEAAANILIYHQQMMSRLSARFFSDMDSKYRHLRDEYESNSRDWATHMHRAIRYGIKQGVFRKDANYEVIVPLFRVQMESLKRMEEFFPPGITLVEAYNAIGLGLLRSIATPQGMEVLDSMSDKFRQLTSTDTNI